MADKPRGCLKLGCLGCIGAVVLLLAAAVGVVVLGWALARPESAAERTPVERTLERPAESGGAGADRPIDSPLPGELAPMAAAPGRVEIDLSEGEFEVVPAEPGAPASVEGEYDRAAYELEARSERLDDGRWVYRVRLARRGGWLRSLFSGKESRNHLRVALPRGAPFALEATFARGRAEVELGGLALTRARIGGSMGELAVGFGEPLAAPAERIEIEGSMGQLSVARLGNASPREARFAQSMGQLELDLRGAWRGDGEIDASASFGELALRLPGDAEASYEIVESKAMMGGVELPPGRTPTESAADLPAVRLRLSARFGGVRVGR